jgi:hypothetical protein
MNPPVALFCSRSSGNLNYKTFCSIRSAAQNYKTLKNGTTKHIQKEKLQNVSKNYKRLQNEGGAFAPPTKVA